MNRTLEGDVQFHNGEIGISQCVWCRHRAADGRKCRAFPAGIPDAIANNRHDHRDPYDGDRGVRFEPEAVEIEFVDLESETQPSTVSAAPTTGRDPAIEAETPAADVVELDGSDAADDVVFDLEAVLSA